MAKIFVVKSKRANVLELHFYGSKPRSKWRLLEEFDVEACNNSACRVSECTMVSIPLLRRGSMPYRVMNQIFKPINGDIEDWLQNLNSAKLQGGFEHELSTKHLADMHNNMMVDEVFSRRR